MTWLNLITATSFMPVQASEVAKNVDHLYLFLLVSSLISFVILIGGMTWFILNTGEKRTRIKLLISHTIHWQNFFGPLFPW